MHVQGAGSAPVQSHKGKGDRVWVDISHDKGKNWRGCGGVTTDGKRTTWCATVGDVKQGSARWWSDK